MNKKLKIQFWKSEKALAMQILEQEGLPKKFIGLNVNIIDAPFLGTDWIDLRGSWIDKDNDVVTRLFSTNSERDEYFKKAVNAITDELFTGKGELKVGERCMVSDDGEMLQDSGWFTLELLAILPNSIEKRYICRMPFATWDSKAWKYARSIAKRIEPKIEECGNVVTYTWEDK